MGVLCQLTHVCNAKILKKKNVGPGGSRDTEERDGREGKLCMRWGCVG